MKTDQTFRRWLSQLTVQASLFAAATLGLAGTAGAADVTVDCDGPGPANFGTISDALANLSLEGPNTIFVLPGICVENVAIDNRERLTIDAPDSNLTIVPADPDQPVIHIRDSRSIVLRSLGANNSNFHGIVVTSSTGVRLEGNNTDLNGTGGYSVDDHSSVYFSSNTTTGNGGAGLLVARSSYARVEGATLTGNAGAGIECRDGSTCHLDGNVVIDNNGGAGLAAVNNSLIRVVASTGPNTVQRNAGGISFSGNSTVVLTGPNGNFVTDNNGPGIALEQSSNLSVNNSTVSNNSGPGVTVLRHSMGGFFGSTTIRNNGGANLKCDATSLFHGDALGGISKIDCRNLERSR